MYTPPVIFLVLIFVALIAMLCTGEATSVVLAFTLVTNIVCLVGRYIKTHAPPPTSPDVQQPPTPPSMQPPSAEHSTRTSPTVSTPTSAVDHAVWDLAYREPYQQAAHHRASSHPVYPDTTSAADIDTRIDNLVRLRTRDKQQITGAIHKDVDYYRHHFAEELDETEAREWHGRGEV